MLGVHDIGIHDEVDVDGADVHRAGLKGIGLEGVPLEGPGLAEAFQDQVRGPAADQDQGLAVRAKGDDGLGQGAARGGGDVVVVVGGEAGLGHPALRSPFAAGGARRPALAPGPGT